MQNVPHSYNFSLHTTFYSIAYEWWCMRLNRDEKWEQKHMITFLQSESCFILSNKHKIPNVVSCLAVAD